ncbi:MAG TPA: hypothetical protein VEH52_04620 [Gaiellaceae bacterium]|nr:hypothetical protein [Gaiellaceae bacterium]
MRRCIACAWLLALACAAFALPASGTTSTELGRDGIQLRLPAHWTGVIYQRVGGLPILHAASFRLPPVDGDDGALRAAARMRPGDVLIVMLEYRPTKDEPSRTVPHRLRRSDFGKPVEGMPLSHAFARIGFTSAGRVFDLWIEFGGKRASVAAIRAADRVLATLHVGPR